jgi:hypothetical protein
MVYSLLRHSSGRFDSETRKGGNMKKYTNLDCLVADPTFQVFRAGDCSDGSLYCCGRHHGPIPPDTAEYVFEVWDAEGNVLTPPLPFIDCCWISDALNSYSDAEE